MNATVLQVQKLNGKDTIVLLDKEKDELAARRCLELLMNKSNGCLKIARFTEMHIAYYSEAPDWNVIKHSLSPAIMVSTC